MGKIYTEQTALTIQLTVGEDITGATALIKYKKPSGDTGNWTAEIIDATNGIIRYLIDSGTDLDESGLWTFWADITFSSGLWAPGEPIREYIYNSGT